jgi:hypothetical protein
VLGGREFCYFYVYFGEGRNEEGSTARVMFVPVNVIVRPASVSIRQPSLSTNFDTQDSHLVFLGVSPPKSMSEEADLYAASESQLDKALFSSNDVLQSSNEVLYGNVADLTIQLAILGCTNTAANLVGRLNNYDWYHGQQVIVRPLYILWDQINHWPDGEKQRLRESIQEERRRAAEKKVKNEQGEETAKKIKLEVDDSPITDKDIKRGVDDLYYSYSKCWWYPERPYLWAYPGVHVPPSPHDRNISLSAGEMKQKIKDLISAAEGKLKGAEPTDPSAALVSALELRIKMKEKSAVDDDNVPSERDILTMIAKNLNRRSQMSELIQSRRAWPMLRSGALLDILGINKSKVDLFARQLEEAITERMAKGRRLLPDLSTKELVELINTNSRTSPASIKYYEQMDVDVPTTILRDPALPALIQETEQRLGTKLPEDFKEYLSITNGNDPAWGGIIQEAPIWRCEDIRWISDKEDYFSDMCVDIPANMASITNDISGDGLDWPHVGKSLIVGREDVDHIFLIAPESIEQVKDKVRSILGSEDEKVTRKIKDSVEHAVRDFAGSMQEFEKLDWCCVLWSEQMEAFKSFKAYLRHVAEWSGRSDDDRDLWNLGYREFFGYMLVDQKS